MNSPFFVIIMCVCVCVRVYVVSLLSRYCMHVVAEEHDGCLPLSLLTVFFEGRFLNRPGIQHFQLDRLVIKCSCPSVYMPPVLGLQEQWPHSAFHMSTGIITQALMLCFLPLS